MSEKLRRAVDLGYLGAMRTVIGCAHIVTLLFVLSCGGHDTESSGAKAPPALSGELPTEAGKPSGAEQGTTTLALSDGGDEQGAKLTQTRTVTSTSTVATPLSTPGGALPVKGQRGREPGRGPDDIRAIIMARRDEARACYDNALKEHPGIEGDLVIAWTIDPKGNVTQTALDTSKSQLVEPGVVSCVSDIIKKIQFAPSAGGYETKAFYPFNFHPHHGTAPRTP